MRKRSVPSSSATGGQGEKGGACEPGSGSSPDPDHAGTPTWDSEQMNFCCLTEQFNRWLPSMVFCYGRLSWPRQIPSCFPDTSGASSPPRAKHCARGLGVGCGRQMTSRHVGRERRGAVESSDLRPSSHSLRQAPSLAEPSFPSSSIKWGCEYLSLGAAVKIHSLIQQITTPSFPGPAELGWPHEG